MATGELVLGQFVECKGTLARLADFLIPRLRATEYGPYVYATEKTSLPPLDVGINTIFDCLKKGVKPVTVCEGPPYHVPSRVYLPHTLAGHTFRENQIFVLWVQAQRHLNDLGRWFVDGGLLEENSAAGKRLRDSAETRSIKLQFLVRLVEEVQLLTDIVSGDGTPENSVPPNGVIECCWKRIELLQFAIWRSFSGPKAVVGDLPTKESLFQ